MKQYVFKIDPVSKPRMTKRDSIKFLNAKYGMRKCVAEYWEYKAELIKQANKEKFEMPESGSHVKFFIKMPKSWSKNQKAYERGKFHRQKPDVDNILKGFMDALCKEDKSIADVRVSKFWSEVGFITVDVD